MALTIDSIVRIARDAVSCELDGETAILNVKSGDYYGLDEVGASVWRMMSQPHTVAEIIREITYQYDVDPAQCEGDLISLIGKLASHGLIEINNQA
ncbi:MAG: PqqD family protein [Deltaproteobacteria bacterium]|nr:PqqD family protein [Deltaproteobacteria bacterium]